MYAEKLKVKVGGNTYNAKTNQTKAMVALFNIKQN